MVIESLRVAHLSKQAVGSSVDLSDLFPHAYCLNSCQRWLWVDQGELGAEATPFPNEAALRSTHPQLEIYPGVSAYAFLLRVASGLESEVLGETDVFGQFKQSWQQWLGREKVSHDPKGDLKSFLNPWMQKLFEDTKEIRAKYLHNLGGASYGSLVRKLIREKSADSAAGPVLIVGAGKIACSVAPYFLEGNGRERQEIWLLNRSEKNANSLLEDLIDRSKGESKVSVLKYPDEEARAWREAAHVIVCIPMDPLQDGKRVRLWNQGFAWNPNRVLVHLGGLKHECGPWSQVRGFHSLEDLFTLQKSLTQVRSVQVMRARKACIDRAKLRALGGSLSVPHGWEDLAVFG